MAREYVHQELNREVTAIGGHYLLVKEVRLPFRGREVLYVGLYLFQEPGELGCVGAVRPTQPNPRSLKGYADLAMPGD